MKRQENITPIQHEKKFMSVLEFKEKYQLGLNRAYQIVKTEGFPCIFLGNRCLILKSLVDEWFLKNIGKKF